MPAAAVPCAAGIYEIRCGSRTYVGSSKNCRARVARHVVMLTAQSHVNPKLQAAHNKYGSTVRVLLLCAPLNLLFYEQRALDMLRPSLNIATQAGAPMRGRKMPAVAVEKLRERMRGNTYTLGHKPTEETRAKLRLRPPHPRFGQSPSAETRAKLSAAQRGRTFSTEHRARISEGQRKRWVRERGN